MKKVKLPSSAGVIAVLWIVLLGVLVFMGARELAERRTDSSSGGARGPVDRPGDLDLGKVSDGEER